jgi:hypothetical protein
MAENPSRKEKKGDVCVLYESGKIVHSSRNPFFLVNAAKKYTTCPIIRLLNIYFHHPSKGKRTG